MNNGCELDYCNAKILRNKMMQIEIDLSKLERGTHEGRVKVTRGGKTFWRKQRIGQKGDEKVLAMVIDKEVKVISDKLEGYADDYDKEGKEALKNDCIKIVELLKNGKAKEASKLFAGSDLKYDIGNTYDELNDYVDKKYIAKTFGEDWGTKPGEYVAYRSGEVKGEKRGIFLSMDRKGAKMYSKGGEVKTIEYRVNIKNPLVGERVEEVYADLVGENAHEVYERKNRSGDINKFWRELDAKVITLAEKEGYDSIVYTKPAPPALRELVLVSSESIINKE